MPQLDPTWFASQLFWLAITFVLLYIILSRVVLPPLQDVIARRAAAQAQDIEAAQSLKYQAESAQVEYERMGVEAREKTQALLNEALLVAKAKAEQANRDVDQQIAKKLAEAGQKIAAKKQELKDSLTPAATELATEIVSRLTQKAPAADRVTAIVGDLTKQNKG